MANEPTSIKILGETFWWEDGFLAHPQWSLTGHGSNLAECLVNFVNSAKEVYPHYAIMDDTQLTQEAISLRNWLRDFLTVDNRQPH